ncbi:phage holin family protein [Streptomyces indicus]|uniref:Putative Holin-X, holin superfamily III n=1 Tax=Streptomyces indicus TaxID=417292 RepID=A0A1G9BZH8_9ACTN|nr:phage holin family protein [Streptomyces indicus]SDK44859.1 Putative Holin-X, holin superfamily III [Streptomyces indicus]
MSAADGGDQSLGQLVASATSEMSALIHDEIALAKAQLRTDVKRGATSGGAFIAALAVLIFSLPMLSFALAYGIHAWSDWHLSVCFLLSFAASVLLAGLLALIGVVFAKKTSKSKGPQKVAASAKETAAVLGNVKPHPRPVTAPARGELTRAVEDAKPVARSSS